MAVSGGNQYTRVHRATWGRTFTEKYLRMYEIHSVYNQEGHVLGSINSLYFHIIGDGHQPNSRGLYNHYKDSLLKVGWVYPQYKEFRPWLTWTWTVSLWLWGDYSEASVGFGLTHEDGEYQSVAKDLQTFCTALVACTLRGWRMTRPRLYSVLIHKEKASLQNFPLKMKSVFRRPHQQMGVPRPNPYSKSIWVSLWSRLKILKLMV